MKKQTTDTANALTPVPKRAKRRKFASLVTSGTAIALSLIFSMAVGLSGCKNSSYFTAPESKLPIKDEYALNRYDYDEASSLQATLRADILNVTERGIERQTPEILTDEFSLVYEKTGTKNELRAEYGYVAPGAG